MLSDLTFLTNEPERKLSARLNDLLAKSSRCDWPNLPCDAFLMSKLAKADFIQPWRPPHWRL